MYSNIFLLCLRKIIDKLKWNIVKGKGVGRTLFPSPTHNEKKKKKKERKLVSELEKIELKLKKKKKNTTLIQVLKVYDGNYYLFLS